MKKGLAKKIGISALAVGSLIPGNVNAQEKLDFEASSTLTSHYVAMGYVLGKGPHKQDNIKVSKGNLSFFVWDDYDFGSKDLMEIDVGAEYNLPVSDKTTWNMSYIYMHYPQGDDDNVMSLGIKNEGFFKTQFDLINFFQDKEIPNGLLIHGKISKDFELGEKNELSLGVSGHYAHNFYKDFGPTNVTPEIILSRSGKKLDFSAFIKQQFGFIKEPKMLPAAKNQFYYGGTLSKSF